MSPPIVSSLAVVRRRAWSSSSSRAVNRRKNRCWPSVSTRSARSPVTVSLIVLVMSSTFLVGIHDARQLSGQFLTALTGYSWHGQHEFADAATAFAVADAPVLAGDGSRRPAGGIAANPAPRRRPAARARLPGRGPARRRGRVSTRRRRRPATARARRRRGGGARDRAARRGAEPGRRQRRGVGPGAEQGRPGDAQAAAAPGGGPADDDPAARLDRGGAGAHRPRRPHHRRPSLSGHGAAP